MGLIFIHELQKLILDLPVRKASRIIDIGKDIANTNIVSEFHQICKLILEYDLELIHLLIPYSILRKIRIKDAINIIIAASINHLSLPD